MNTGWWFFSHSHFPSTFRYEDFQNIATLKAFYSEHPCTYHPDLAICYVLYHMHNHLHPLVHFIFLMHFKVSCRHQYSNPQFTSFLNNIVVFEELEYEFYVLNVSKLLSQRISDDSIILEWIV